MVPRPSPDRGDHHRAGPGHPPALLGPFELLQLSNPIHSLSCGTDDHFVGRLLRTATMATPLARIFTVWMDLSPAGAARRVRLYSGRLRGKSVEVLCPRLADGTNLCPHRSSSSWPPR